MTTHRSDPVFVTRSDHIHPSASGADAIARGTVEGISEAVRASLEPSSENAGPGLALQSAARALKLDVLAELPQTVGGPNDERVLPNREGIAERIVAQAVRRLVLFAPDVPPRLYSDEERERATTALQAAWGWTSDMVDDARDAVDAVAEALGMRRAGE